MLELKHAPKILASVGFSLKEPFTVEQEVKLLNIVDGATGSKVTRVDRVFNHIQFQVNNPALCIDSYKRDLEFMMLWIKEALDV